MLLTRLPLPLRGARLACVKPAASVRSEPGSNSQVENSIMTDHYVLNRRELTRPTPHHCDTGLMFSYQNVTVICLLNRQNRNSVRENRRPRFSFFSYSIVKKLTIPSPKRLTVGKTPVRTQSPEPNQHALILDDFSRTKDIVASSAAALVGERFIVPHTKTSQRPILKKCHYSSKPSRKPLYPGLSALLLVPAVAFRSSRLHLFHQRQSQGDVPHAL